MTQALASIVRALPRPVIDDVLVQSITSEMRDRLAAKRDQGRGGWQGDDCSNAVLLELLHKNLREGDMVDVINLAGMIHLRRQAFGESIPVADASIATCGVIDVRQPPKMIRIAADGSNAKAGEPHVAVLLPQYGLMFSAEKPVPVDSVDGAIRLASEMRLLGYDDWCPGEINEQRLLINYDRVEPAAFLEYFPHTPKSGWCWTTKTHASDPGYAWVVNFNHGLVGYDLRDNCGFLRAVRRVSPSQ